MKFRNVMLVLLASAAPLPAFAQVSGGEKGQAGADAPKSEDTQIVVTAARTILPPNALPLTIDIIDKQALDQQIILLAPSPMRSPR